MKNRGLAFWLSFILLFSMTGFAFADTEEEVSQTEPVKIEKEVEQPTTVVEQPKQEETQKEEVKKEEPQIKEVKQINTKAASAENVKNEREDIQLTLEFKDIKQANGDIKEKNTSNKISNGGGWGFSKKKFESTTGLRTGQSFSFMGYEYTYNGKWQKDDTIIDADKTTWFYNKDGEDLDNKFYLNGDTTLTFTPVWEKEKIQGLDYYYIDNISTGSGSWSNADAFDYKSKFGSFTHTFSDPSVKTPVENYQFVEWKDEENNTTYKAGDSFTYTVYANHGDEEYTIYAYWQPAVVVNLYNDNELVKTISSFESISSSEFEKLADTDTQKFVGWLDENGMISDIYYAPGITKEEGYLVINLTAQFEDIVIPVPTPDPEPPIVTPDKSDPKVVAKTKTNNTIIYYGMGDGIVSTPEPAHTVLPTTKTPFTSSAETGAWAFLNLLVVLANFVVCIFLLLMAFINNKKEDDETEVKNRMLGRICTLIIAIVSGIIFLFTEDTSLPMVWVDQWTILMICTFVLQLIVGFLSRHKEEEIEQEHE